MKKIDTKNNSLYPWGGDFSTGDETSNVAVALLNTSFIPSKKVAIYGKLKTENIGIEKIVANIISNPYIRFLIVCGEDIRGHRSGKSLLCLHENGIDENNKIINAPGAIPYIENIDVHAINRFQNQIEIIDFINTVNEKSINDKIQNLMKIYTEPYGEPFIAIQLKKEKDQSTEDKRALHSKIMIDYMGKVKKRK